MITLHIKLYGALPEQFPGYDPEKGLTLKLPRAARIADLAEHLGLLDAAEMVIAMNGRVARPDEVLEEGAALRIFPKAHGG